MNRHLTYKFICERVINWEGFTFEEINTKCRDREICFTRQLCMYLGLVLINITTVRAAGYFGKDHATAIHAKHVIQNLMDTDRKIREKVMDYISRFSLGQDIQLPLKYEIMRRSKLFN
jgi:chromosomal replication initiation ATPase DnaA